ncbi:hypothetical protein [Epinotia aporema granulovirus]|uniref:Uncharacterized protein n=1 Tax=Epinotia aporema granulovirus TaxID=166056 RepID=K4EQU3_9BBAC|nr:hypothetical protein [Epinotia aporema granulovirus]AER41536.1 hypothetical protein [Epinotia aporema granulovirus]
MLKKKQYHHNIISVVKNMLLANSLTKSPSSVEDKFKLEYYESCNKMSGQTFDTILSLFRYMCATPEVLYTFFDNDLFINYSINLIPNKINVIVEDVRVTVSMYYNKDVKICVECWEKLRDKDLVRLNEEKLVRVEESYWFCLNYICDYCFTNKLYTKA